MKELTGIILSAGMGTRLGPLTLDKPKALVKIAGWPLVFYAINFMKNLGADKIIVVGGFFYDRLKEAVSLIDPDIGMIENPDYQKGTLYSLKRGLENVEGNAVFMVGDHIFPKAVARKIKPQLGEGIIVFTDYDRSLGDDDMKILTSGNGMRLKEISKKLQNYDRGYVGVSFCHQQSLLKLRNALDSVKILQGENANVEHALQYLADQNFPIAIGDISGHKWMEVDYPEELERAQEELSVNYNLYV